jgi:hypothetical protein
MKRKQTPRTQKKNTKKNKGAFVLFIGDDGAVLTYFEQKHCVRRLFAPNTEEKSVEALVQLLGEFPTAPISVLVDVLDQAYVRHTLPPVTALGVNKIIQRRLSRDFAAEDLKGAISLGREQKGRKDWNFLLISLAYNDRLKGWLSLLYDLPNRLKGIYLSPVESEAILQQLKTAISHNHDTVTSKKKKSTSPSFSLSKSKKQKDVSPEQARWDILVLNNKTGGFRQVVLKNGKLVFTRMAQAAMNEKPTVLAGNIEQEVKNTIEYLKRLSFAQGSVLSIMIIIGEEIKTHISTEGFNATESMVYTPHEAAELLGIGDSVLSGDRFTDIFLSSAFLQLKKPRLKLLSVTLKHTEKFYLLHNAIVAFSMLTILGLLGMSGYHFYEGFTMNSKIKENKKEFSTLTTRIEKFKEDTKDFKEDPLKIDALIKIDDTISIKGASFLKPLKDIAPFITDSAKITIFDWSNLHPSLPTPSTTTQSAAGTPAIATNLTDNGQHIHPFAAVIQWSLTTKTGEEKKAKEQWDTLFATLKDSLKDYTIESKGLENDTAQQNQITINFEDRSNRNATSALPAPSVKIEMRMTHAPSVK